MTALPGQFAAHLHCRVPRCAAPRGFILPAILLILILLGLLAASFAFEMHADVASTQAVAHRIQTRLAAEAGIQRVGLLLRSRRLDIDAWYNNPEELHRVVVWKSGQEPTEFGVRITPDVEDGPAFRFSIVADDFADDEFLPRYGITDEAAKLNVNVATEEQLRTLIAQIAPPEAVVDELVDALLDWIDADATPRPNGAEEEHYITLDPPRLPKNAPLDTIEELLMVRGFTAQVLYGEDWDRNGLLSINEDDGEETFPWDDGDGELNRGLLPYVTVRSREFNSANDNKPRIHIGGAGEQTAEQLADYFSEEEIAFIQSAMAAEGDDKIQLLPDLLRSHTKDDQEVVSPFTTDDLPLILDRLTLDPTPEFAGLININTAPPQVLRCIPHLPEGLVAEIITQRAAASAEAKLTPAWLVTSQVMDVEQLKFIVPFITTRGLQFTVESLGYADHIGMVTRLQAIIEMRGPVAQIVYYRDLTPLGIGYPIRLEDEKEGGRPRAARSS